MNKIKSLFNTIRAVYDEAMKERFYFLVLKKNMDYLREKKKRQAIVECVFDKHLDDIDATRREALRSVARLN